VASLPTHQPPWPSPGIVPSPIRSLGPESASEQAATTGEATLARLAADVDAQAIALARFDQPGKFRIVASIGLPLLPINVSLPIETSTLVHGIATGHDATVSFLRGDHPLDSIAANVGLRFGHGLAVVSDRDEIVGAVVIGWTEDEPTADVADLAIAEHQRRALCAMLTAQESPTVVVVHEDWLLAAGLARTLERSLGATAEIATSAASAASLMATSRPDLIVCSDRISIAEGLEEATRQLRVASPDAPVLVVTRCCNSESYDLALRAGAKGYLPLETADKHLTEYASKLLEGETALPPTPPKRVEAHLTGREQQVLRCFERGMYDKQIAGELGVALSTVKTHARGIYAKLGVGTRTAAIYRARAHGLI